MSIWEAKLDWCGLEKKRGEEVGRGEDIGVDLEEISRRDGFNMMKTHFIKLPKS